MNISQNIQSSMVKWPQIYETLGYSRRDFSAQERPQESWTKSNGYVRSRRESRGVGVETQHAGSESSASSLDLATSEAPGYEDDHDSQTVES